MQDIYNLSPEILYNEAIKIETQDYGTYIIYLTMAANYDYQLAIDILNNTALYNKENYEITIPFYKDSIKHLSQNSYSLNNLAFSYMFGLGVTKNITKAKKIYKLAIKKGNITSMHNLACLYKDYYKKYDKAISFLEKPVILRHKYSMNVLGHIYLNVISVRNYVKAKKLFEESSALGNSDALKNLAYMYIYGLGVQKDYSKGKKLIEEAINLGSVDAINILAHVYKNGFGVIQNYSKAIELYTRATSLNDNISFCNLAHMYENGLGVDQNYDIAINFYKQAYSKDYIESLDAMIKIFKLDYFHDRTNEIIDYLNEINQLEKLRDIYGLDTSIINIIRKKYELETKIMIVEKENAELKVHIESSPDGKLYMAAKQEWNKLK